MPCSDAVLGWMFGALACLLKFGNSILTPLFLDSITPADKLILNITSPEHIGTSTPAWERIDPFFCIWFSMGFDTLLLGTILGIIMICCPQEVTERERQFPKSVLMGSGSAQAFSALLFQFSTSGSRTPPYLMGALAYFFVPIAFILRYFMLKKKPTKLKAACATIIVLAEIVCLVPSMIPNMESNKDRMREGGASGVGRVLWPLCFALSGVPHAIWSILLEKSVQHEKDDSNSTMPDIRRLNMIYVMFWNFLGTLVTALGLFWIDLIPGFGLLPSIDLFPSQLLFNIKCIFGATPQCGFHQLFTGWGRMICKTGAFVSVGLLLRYSEGASFYAILVAMMQPLRFLFFTVFEEQPFRWNPHATLSTWLSVVALCIMLPTVIIYNTYPWRRQQTQNDEADPLLAPAAGTGSAAQGYTRRIPKKSNNYVAVTDDEDDDEHIEQDPLLRTSSSHVYGSINSDQIVA